MKFMQLLMTKNNLEVRSVYLDMSKAFDKVWHAGLVFKLKQNGIDSKLLALHQNCLSNRKQRVLINGSESNWSNIQSGVPEGSVLVPLSFSTLLERTQYQAALAV